MDAVLAFALITRTLSEIALAVGRTESTISAPLSANVT